MNQSEILEAGKRVMAILPTINKPALAMLIAKVANMDFGDVEKMLSPLYVEPIKVGDKLAAKNDETVYTMVAEFSWHDTHYFVGIADPFTFCIANEQEWQRLTRSYNPAATTSPQATAAQLLAHLKRQGVSNG